MTKVEQWLGFAGLLLGLVWILAESFAGVGAGRWLLQAGLVSALAPRAAFPGRLNWERLTPWVYGL